MSTVNQDLRPAASAFPAGSTAAAPDVVAGLQNDGSAYAVARAAAREAAQRGSRVKFVQVAGEGVAPEERDELDRSTFRAALQALKGLHRVPCTFEVVDGDPGPALVARSADAGLLVVGRDRLDGGRGVALHCQRHASCDVLTITPR
jgi:nucleotide-binding universal stress UspA family protein